MDPEIQALLGELDEAIRRSQAEGRLDEGERAELRTLLARAERVLGREGGGDDEGGEEDEGVVAHLEAAARRLEADHPGLAGVLRSTVSALSGYGI